MVDIERDAPFAPAGEFARRRILQLGVASVIAAGMLAGASVADARTTRIQILSRTTAFGGYSFPGVGQYEVITGIATGEVDPNDSQNAMITDIQLAPKNPKGHVVYQHNFYILKPLDLSNGNHKMMYEPPNRGGKTYQALNNTPSGTNDPAAITDPNVLANSFLWPQGYTTVWSGWENNLGLLTSLTATATLQVATNPDGSTITGPGYEYIVSPGATYTLAYPAASGSQAPASATLTHRVHLDDTPQIVPASGWAYTDASNTAIMLTTGSFAANDIYEFSYIAVNPTVNGLGFAAIRDFNSFLRYATADDSGTANPLAGDVTRIYTETSSQPARTLNDFTHLGFNQDESGNKVFDGMMQWIGAGDGINMNYRWSQTKRTERNRQEELYLEGLFPFANQTTTDPISGETDGRYKTCSETKPNTCPLAMEFYSSNEYWVKAGSLMSTDPTGTIDLPDHPDARLYLLSSKQHGGAGNPASTALPTVPQSAQLPASAAGALGRSRPVVDAGYRTATVAGSDAQGRNARAATAGGKWPLRWHPRGDLYRPQNDALPVQLRNELLCDRHTDDQPAGHHAALRGQLRKWSNLSKLCAEGRQRRQRYRRHPAARIDGAAGDVHRLGPALRRLGERWLRRFGTIHPVRSDQGRARCRGRSAAVGR